MAKKQKSVYMCTECGNEYLSWQGQCSYCGSWNTIVEHKISDLKEPSVDSRRRTGTEGRPVKLGSVGTSDYARMSSGISELDRVLGGGIVLGSLVLISGEPGIGKSTLALQVLMKMGEKKTLYASGEESAKQLKLRAERLAGSPDNLYIMAETSLERILDSVTDVQPEVVVIDSIQTIGTETIEASIGSLSQVRECAARILQYAKEKNVPFIIVGHINKEGSLAGPKVLEHIVDTVLQFEGDQHYVYRILRAQKNRFGSTSELGIFEMQQDGLREVDNPSELLLSNNRDGLSGIAIAAAVEGVRPLLIEVQALVASAAYGTPQRSSTGFDARRLNMLLAVLEKRVGFKLLQKDVFVNIAGGIRVNDPAIDMAVLAAVLSSNMDVALDEQTCITGEVGLAGEIRPVNRIDQRIREAEKLGFKTIVVPKGQKYNTQNLKINVVEISRVVDAFKFLFKK
jgi:DNA repair protein RadA/Sms